MTGFDWVIIIILVISTVLGVIRGFVREALSILSWIVALWLASTFCAQAGEYITQFVAIPAPAFRVAAGFAAIFVITLFVFSLVSYLLTKLLVRDGVKGTDRVLGLGFGFLRAVAIVALLMVAIKGLGLNNSDWWNKSQLISHFQPVAGYLESVLPEEWRSDVSSESSIVPDSEEVLKQNAVQEKTNGV